MPSGMENIAPSDLTELSQARKRAENYQRRLYGSQKKLKRSQKRIEMQAEDLSRKGAHIGELEEEIAHLAKESEVMMSKIAHQAEERAEDKKQLHNLKAKIKQVPNRIANAITTTTSNILAESTTDGPSLQLKNKSVIPDDTCELINDLIAEDGVNPERVLSVLNRMANHLGVPIEGSVSDRSTRRIVQEGGAAAKMQVVQCMKNAKGMSY